MIRPNKFGDCLQKLDEDFTVVTYKSSLSKVRRTQITRKQNYDFSSPNLFQVLGDEIGNQDFMEDHIDHKQVQELSQEKLKKSTLTLINVALFY